MGSSLNVRRARLPRLHQTRCWRGYATRRLHFAPYIVARRGRGQAGLLAVRAEGRECVCAGWLRGVMATKGARGAGCGRCCTRRKRGCRGGLRRRRGGRRGWLHAQGQLWHGGASAGSRLLQQLRRQGRQLPQAGQAAAAHLLLLLLLLLKTLPGRLQCLRLGACRGHALHGWDGKGADLRVALHRQLPPELGLLLRGGQLQLLLQ